MLRLLSLSMCSVSWLLLGVGCADDTEKPCRGGESCECYANGTCDEGLVCLSEHCVDLTPDASMRESMNASAVGTDASLGDGGGAFETSDASDEPRSTIGIGTSSGRSSNHTGASTRDSTATLDDTAASTADTTDSTVPVDESSTAEEASTDAVESTDSATSSGEQPNTSTSDTASGATTESTSVSSNPTSADPTSTPQTDTSDAATTDVTSGPLSIPVLAARNENALDDAASPGIVSSGCASPQSGQTMCYSPVQCAGQPCNASFEWTFASVILSTVTQTLYPMDLSGDGTVLVGNWALSSNTNSRAFALRWGALTVTLLAPDDESFSSAVNADATAAAGSVETCVGQDCSYPGGRFEREAWYPAPGDVNLPSDISDGLAIVSYDRPDTELVSTIWTSGTPSLIEGISLESLSGDAEYAAGVFEETSQLLLYYSAGSRAIPSTGDYIYYSGPSINADGSVVVCTSWGPATATSPLLHWETNQQLPDPGTVTVVQPTGTFTDVVPFGLSASGAAVVGVQRRGLAPSAPQDTEAFYWDENGGLRSLSQELAERGITLPNNVYLHDAYISADGSTIAGKGLYQGAAMLWRVRLAQ